MPISPITPLVVGNNGAWLAVRLTSAQGSCGVHGYPCQHPGVDVVGPAGTPVSAPEDGVVIVAADGAAPPFVGYGPWLVLMRGASGKYHLLGHLDPGSAAMAPVGARVTQGQVIGRTSSANHTHWEVRTNPTPGSGKTNFDNNSDPIAWMKGGSSFLLLALLGGGAYWIWRTYKQRG